MRSSSHTQWPMTRHRRGRNKPSALSASVVSGAFRCSINVPIGSSGIRRSGCSASMSTCPNMALRSTWTGLRLSALRASAQARADRPTPLAVRNSPAIVSGPCRAWEISGVPRAGRAMRNEGTHFSSTGCWFLPLPGKYVDAPAWSSKAAARAIVREACRNRRRRWQTPARGKANACSWVGEDQSERREAERLATDVERLGFVAR